MPAFETVRGPTAQEKCLHDCMSNLHNYYNYMCKLGNSICSKGWIIYMPNNLIWLQSKEWHMQARCNITHTFCECSCTSIFIKYQPLQFSWANIFKLHLRTPAESWHGITWGVQDSLTLGFASMFSLSSHSSLRVYLAFPVMASIEPLLICCLIAQSNRKKGSPTVSWRRKRKGSGQLGINYSQSFQLLGSFRQGLQRCPL